MENSCHPTPFTFNDDRSIDENEPLDKTFLIDRFLYASRLTSNDVPSDDEMEEIKAFLHKPKAKLHQIEAEIASESLQARVDFLQRRHAALKTQVQACESLITIGRRLPDDILLEIFFFCCLPEIRSPELDSKACPILLTAICRRWRLLALQTPKLWSTIDLDIHRLRNGLFCAGIRDSRATEYIDYMLSKWLERSGTCPLTFSISTDYRDSMFPVCSNILLRFASQWKNIFLYGNFETLSTFFIDPPPNLESLESLFLHLSDHQTLVFPAFNSPNLRKVSIRCYVLDSSTLPLPWTRLTHLDLGSRYYNNVHGNRWNFPRLSTLSTLLNQCTSLIYLGLDVDYGHQVNPIYLPCLQRLTLHQPEPIEVRDLTATNLFAEKLEAPSLNRLSLRKFSCKAFLAILSRHGRHLQSLDLNVDSKHKITNEDLADGLRHCPSLESLSLICLEIRYPSHLKVDETFFRLFTGGDGTSRAPSPLCPKLQHLSFDRLGCHTLTGLVSFVEKKQNPELPGDLSPLEKLSIESVSTDGALVQESVVRKALQPFIDKGLRFEMWDKNRRPFYYGGTQDWYDGLLDSRFQHADCWRD